MIQTSSKILGGINKEVIDSYMEGQEQRDLAIELPTGAGKTLVGMLIAEYRRIVDGWRVAYLCPTRQLCSQVVLQASSYGIRAVNLSGSKHEYDQAEKMAYDRGQAIAVCTYSGLFNVSPGVANPNLVVCDDAHASEGYVIDMWRMLITRHKHEGLFNKLVTTLSPVLPSRCKMILQASEEKADRTFVELVSPILFQRIASEVERCFEEHELPDDLKYSWSRMSHAFTTAMLCVKYDAIEIRPYIAPTFSHKHFDNAQQRLYLTATLGKNGDLERYFGRRSIHRIPVPNGWEKKGTGRRLILFPAYAFNVQQAMDLYYQIQTHVGRSLVLTDSTANSKKIAEWLEKRGVKVLTAADTESNLKKFTESTQSTALIVANRYDGLDFKGDECRLMLVFGLPSGAGLFEQFLYSRLAAHTLLRDRIRTRVTQAVGRCTRDESDYSLVLVVGPKLQSWFARTENTKGMLPELQAEIKLGVENSDTDDASALYDLCKHFFARSDEWAKADDYIINERDGLTQSEDETSAKLGGLVSREVLYSDLMWQGNYERAFEEAKRIADDLGGNDYRPFRGLWHHNAATSAFYAWRTTGKEHFRDACLFQLECAAGSALGLAWMSDAKAAVDKSATNDPSEVPFPVDSWFSNLESILSKWNYSGPRFAKEIDHARTLIKDVESSKFEQGLEILGRMLGADAHRWPDEQGAPDGYWNYVDWHAVLWEAKTKEKSEGVIGKKSVQQAHGHPARAMADGLLPPDVVTSIALVSDRDVLHSAAKPFMADVYRVSHRSIVKLFERAAEALTSFRGQAAALPSGAGVEIAVEIYKRNQVFPTDVVKELKLVSLADLETT